MGIEQKLEQILKRKAEDGSLRSLIFSSLDKNNDPEAKSAKAQNRGGMIDFSSNDYLGLAHCPVQLKKVSDQFESFKKRLIEPFDKEGASHPPLLGATGSRLLSGDSYLSNEVERDLAKVHNREGALLFNSGYDANLSVLSCIPSSHDFVILDDLCHNSLIMGVRMGRGRDQSSNNLNGEIIMFRHNDYSHLSQILDHLKTKVQGDSHIFIVVESVYSMDGDIAPLVEIFDLAKTHKASVIIDEAHGLGIYGKTNRNDLNIVKKANTNTNMGTERSSDGKNISKGYGGGTGVLSALRLERHPNCLCSIHTFGKAAGCHGAVITASKTVIQYLVNYARPFIYSTALPPHSIISIKCAYETILSEEGENRRSRVFHLVKLFRERAIESNIPLLESPSPIQAVLTNSLASQTTSNNVACIELARKLRQCGIDVFPIRYPTVKRGEERIRIIIHSHNTEQEVIKLLDVLKVVFHNHDKDFHKEKRAPLSRL